MKWFKFYGQDFQTDPKIGYLTTPQKLMWINLLCIASQDDEHSGVIKFLTESHLKSISGIIDSPHNDDWAQSSNTLDTFEELGLIQRPDETTIIIPKFKEKQETHLTDAERAKKYRENKKSEAKSDDRHEIVTQPSPKRHSRIDKNREEKNIKKESIKKEKPHTSIDYLRNIPDDYIQELHKAYACSSRQVIEKAQKIINYCESKGKSYKDYKAALRSWLFNDYGKRPEKTHIDALSSSNNMNLPKPEEVVSPERMVELRKQALLKIGTMPKHI